MNFKRKQLFRFLFFLLTSSFGLTEMASAQFEGEIRMSVATSGNSPNAASGNMKLLISKAGLRIETEMNTESQTGEKKMARSIVISPSATPKTLLVLDAAQKQYFELDMESMEEQMSAVTGNQDPESIEVKKKGKEKIGSYETERIEITNSNTGQVTQMWIAPKLMTYETFLKAQLGIIRIQMESFGKGIQGLGIDGFPVKIQNAAMVLEVKSIIKGKVSKEKFTVPKGYKKVEANSAYQNTK